MIEEGNIFDSGIIEVDNWNVETQCWLICVGMTVIREEGLILEGDGKELDLPRKTITTEGTTLTPSDRERPLN